MELAKIILWTLGVLMVVGLIVSAVNDSEISVNGTTTASETTVTTESKTRIDLPIPIVYNKNVPVSAVNKTNESFRDADLLGFHTPCVFITVAVKYDMPPGQVGEARWTGGPYPRCEIAYSPTILDSTWREDYIIRHEVAHLYTIGEDDVHGLEFRRVSDVLYSQVGIEVFYLTDSEYPDCFRLDTSRGRSWSQGSEIHCDDSRFFKHFID